jgi:serine/threonine-protein kinase/endoribonuclease IRE1
VCWFWFFSLITNKKLTFFLGFGSHGTVVFQGSLQGRAVAVKRLLNDFVTLAAREVSILQESDDHPNVIRYYYQESHGNFLYIALELCPASLADIVESPEREQWRDIAINFDPKKALRQVASGMRHLHALKLVHRDIKPQNILVSLAKSGGAGVGGGDGKREGGANYRMLISDFGLCKKLDVDQTSFLPTAQGAMGAGTVGWRAPEILRGDVKLDEMNRDDGSFSSRGSSIATVNGSGTTPTSPPPPSSAAAAPTRLTKSVDIFSLGCLFYYTMTNGSHPYGDRYEREGNIMRDVKDLAGLDRFGEEGTEAKDLIGKMLSYEPSGRYAPFFSSSQSPISSANTFFFWHTGQTQPPPSSTLSSGPQRAVSIFCKTHRTGSKSCVGIRKTPIWWRLRTGRRVWWGMIGVRGWTRCLLRIWGNIESMMGRVCRILCGR